MNPLLIKYNETLIERNCVVNLTGHKTLEESLKNNVMDSMLFNDVIAPFMKENASVLDMGSGGGCPAIPLKISFPQIKMTMVDSVRKKTDFLNETVTELGLENTTAIHTRIEEFCTAHRERFDIVTARAVASLNILLEYGLPLLRVGGYMFAFKGSSVDEEIKAATNALQILGGEIVQIETANLDKEIIRTLVIIKKIKPTNKKYPRAKNQPRTNPII
ncbi:MAG: 16S rRNA (guanine(527)-N(7))-methyltransferase RsmG [Firmicutes bacterium]|nr:16S rRNA (guanine(527)-N(7))-methyltransferase RsmG [Bacillota bacterium]